jgi:7-carboxy-7-deazaguanine synthase
MTNAMVDEVFASVQGEGPWAGQRHIFVRFIGCDLRCGYCDTPDAVKDTAGSSRRSCRAQVSPRSFDRELVPNPLDCATLTALCERLIVPGPSRPVVSLTGGEPLLHHAFLKEWLASLRKVFRIYLETNGIQHDRMAELAGLVDIVSMDMKLPSATGERPRWDEHRKFLLAAEDAGLFVKIVVTKTTTDEDVRVAARLLAELDRRLPFIIQPAGGNFAPAPADLVRFQHLAFSVLEDVRVIPQLHKVLCMP